MQNIRAFLMLLGVGLILFVAGSGLALNSWATERMWPHTTIDDVDVSWMTKDEALTSIKEKNPRKLPMAVSLAVDDISIATSSAFLELQVDYQASVDQAFAHPAKNKNPLIGIPNLISSYFSDKVKDTKTPLTYNSQNLDAFVAQIAGMVDTQDLEPKASLKYSGTPSSLTINPGGVGRKVSQEATKDALLVAAANPSQSSLSTLSVSPTIASISAQLSDDQLTAATTRAQLLVGKEIVLSDQGVTIIVPDTDLIEFLAFPEGYTTDKLSSYVNALAPRVNRDPVNAVFEYQEGSQKVSNFSPHQDGLALDQASLINTIQKTIEEKLEVPTSEGQDPPPKSITLTLPTAKKSPDLTLEKTNKLGIKERIGFGESRYNHSIPTRVHNVAHSSEIINHTLVAPGQEFSFNKALGEVSRRTGFQPAYVISGGQTVLGDGGGVCQTSSTLFRALLDSGLNITLRKPHSYRVTYYELNSDPGFDATVYAGEVDLRFINDTAHHILLEFKVDSEQTYMTVEIYGTSDGRTTEISDYKKWGYSPPLPTQYIPSHELPTGRLRQIDWAVSGLKASFVHTVKDKDGKVMRQNTYQSNYRPWAAKYLRGI